MSSGSIFHTYDVRGRYGVEIGPEEVRRLGRAIAGVLPGPFLICRDTRVESRRFERHLRRGLAGATVHGLGLLSTPAAAFVACWAGRTALVCSPSHNPVGEVGLKGFDATGALFSGEWGRIRSAYDSAPAAAGGTDRVRKPRRPAPAPVSSRAAVAAYIGHIRRELEGAPIVLDPRGGAVCRLAEGAAAASRAVASFLDGVPSPTFHGRSPEPRPEELGGLSTEVRRRRALLGATFDGDGDRVLFVDARGRYVAPEIVALALHRARGSAAGVLVASADVSPRMERFAPVARCRVGSRFVLETMRRRRSTVGVEGSAHLYSGSDLGSSDGLAVALELLGLVRRDRALLDRLRAEVGPFHRATLTWTYRSFGAAREAYESLGAALGPSEGLDGYEEHSGHGSLLARRSNTQPAIRWLIEAETPERLRGLRRRVRALRSAVPSGRGRATDGLE